jgi:hypothetical protein
MNHVLPIYVRALHRRSELRHVGAAGDEAQLQSAIDGGKQLRRHFTGARGTMRLQSPCLEATRIPWQL